MLKFPLKFILATTAFAPVILTFAIGYWFDGKHKFAIILLISTIISVVLCVVIIKLAASKLPKNSITIETIRPADKEIIGFVLAYLIPLAHGSQFGGVPMFTALAVFFLVVMTSNAYHTNPLLNLIGYHFYEVTIENVGYMLLSKRDIHNTKMIKKVVSITDYMLLDVTKRK